MSRTLTKPAAVWLAWADEAGNAASESSLPDDLDAMINRALQRVDGACSGAVDDEPVTVTFLADEAAALAVGDWLTDAAFAAAVAWAEGFR